MYSLAVASELIPISTYALEHILSRRPELFNPPCYHTAHAEFGRSSPIRMLTEHECLIVRNLVIKRSGNSRRAGLKSMGTARPTRYGMLLEVKSVE